MDPFVTSDLANKLQETRQDNGVDLVALNIQRAREHGLAPYNTWRRFFNLTTGASFTSLPDIPTAAKQALASVYGYVKSTKHFSQVFNSSESITVNLRHFQPP